MTEYRFSLVPFSDTYIPNINITGRITRQNNVLTIHYSISGETEEIFFLKKSANPTRKDELWTATCFEFFIANPGQPQYWEFNMSSSEDWNIYRMDAYRRIGFREETSIPFLPFKVKQAPSSITVDVSVDLTPLLEPETLIQVGVTSVIQTNDRNESYWALAHPKPQADFHLRESFIIQL